MTNYKERTYLIETDPAITQMMVFKIIIVNMIKDVEGKYENNEKNKIHKNTKRNF